MEIYGPFPWLAIWPPLRPFCLAKSYPLRMRRYTHIQHAHIYNDRLLRGICG